MARFTADHHRSGEIVCLPNLCKNGTKSGCQNTSVLNNVRIHGVRDRLRDIR
jgi:hypothetical protein